MAGHGLGRGQGRDILAEHGAQALGLLYIAHGRGSGVRVDVVDGAALGFFQRNLHAARRAFAGRLDHVMAVRRRAIAEHFSVDGRAARFRPLILFEHHNARAAGNDEAVAVLVERARGHRRAVVIVRAHGAHGVKQVR